MIYRQAMLTGLATGLLGVLIALAFVWSVVATHASSADAAARLYGEREQLRVTLASIGDGVLVADPGGKGTHAQRRRGTAHRLERG